MSARPVPEAPEVRCLPLADVQPDPDQHRKHFPEEYLDGLAEPIRAVVLDVAEGQRLAIQATANLARQDVRPCEGARAYAKIVEHLRAEKLWLSEEDARKRNPRSRSP